MTTGQHVRGHAQPLPRQPLLEGDGEEPVVRPGHDPDRNRRPCREVADRLEHRVGLGPLMVLPGGYDLRRNVMQEIDRQVELWTVVTLVGGGHASLGRSGVTPPCTRRLTGRGDHRVHEDDGTDRDLRGHQRCAEPAQRLRDEYHVATLADGVGDRVCVLGQSGRRVIAGQVDRDRLVPRLLQQGNHAMPVPGGTASTWDENKESHRPICYRRREAISR